MVNGSCLRPMPAEKLFFENRMLEKIGVYVKQRSIMTLPTSVPHITRFEYVVFIIKFWVYITNKQGAYHLGRI